jgi:hypothetical protein
MSGNGTSDGSSPNLRRRSLTSDCRLWSVCGPDTAADQLPVRVQDRVGGHVTGCTHSPQTSYQRGRWSTYVPTRSIWGTSACYAAIVACEGAFPNCNSASHQPRNLCFDQVCIDRNVLWRGRVCRVVLCLTVMWSFSSGCRPLEGFRHEVQNATFIYILLLLPVHYIHTAQTAWSLLLCSGYTQ